MSSAKFTLIGAYQFFHNANDDLFAHLTLPVGLDKDTLTSNILLQGGEFEVQNANPFFIQDAIQIWSSVYADTFQRWVDALAIDYAPLENYDRQEHWTDETEGTGESDSSGTIDSTDEIKKSAFDSGTYSPHTQQVNDTDSTDHTDTSMTSDSEHTGRIHGNIGVTTSQQMLMQELDMGYWNIYNRITELFLKEFVIPVYE